MGTTFEVYNFLEPVLLSFFEHQKIGPILYWKEKMDEFIYHQISKFCNITFFILEQKIIHEVKKWFHVILAVSHLAECPWAKTHSAKSLLVISLKTKSHGTYSNQIISFLGQRVIGPKMIWPEITWPALIGILFFVVLMCHESVQDGFDWHFQVSIHFTLSRAVNKSQQHKLIP